MVGRNIKCMFSLLLFFTSISTPSYFIGADAVPELSIKHFYFGDLDDLLPEELDVLQQTVKKMNDSLNPTEKKGVIEQFEEQRLIFDLLPTKEKDVLLENKLREIEQIVALNKNLNQLPTKEREDLKNLMLQEMKREQELSAKKDAALTLAEKEQLSKVTEEMFTLYDNAKNDLDTVIQTISALDLDVKNDNIVIDNKEEFLKNCASWLDFTHAIRDNLPLHINLDDLDLLSSLNFYTQELGSQFYRALMMKKPHLTPFDEETLDAQCNEYLAHQTNLASASISRKPDTDSATSSVSEESERLKTLQSRTSIIRNGQHNNKTLIKNLETATKEFGLSVFNKCYRSFNESFLKPCDKNLIQPAFKYSIPRKLLVTAASISTIRLGYAMYTRDEHGQFPILGNEGSLLHTVDNTLVDGILAVNGIMQKNVPGSAMLLATGGYAAHGLSSYSDSIQKWLNEKRLNLHHYLLGGSYKKKKMNKMIKLEDLITKPTKNFDDIIGQDHAKQLLTPLVEYIKNPNFYDRNKVQPEKGILISGKPGTGKTLLAEAVAGEIGKYTENIKFLPIPGAVVADADFLASAFDYARANAPCVLFFDEMDINKVNRKGNGLVLRQLLLELSGSLEKDPSKSVFVIVATNIPNALDFALHRHERLGVHIKCEKPGFDDRKRFFQKILNKNRIPADTINLDRLSALTEGQIIPALEAVVNTSVFSALTHRQSITQDLLESNIHKILHQEIPIDSKNLSDDEKRIVSIHQAAQALTMVLLSPKTIFDHVSIKPYLVKFPDNMSIHDVQVRIPQDEKKYGRLSFHHEKDTHGINSYDELYKQCQIAVAGKVAERLLNGHSSNSYKSELNTDYAFKIALEIVSDGIDIAHLTPALRTKYEEQAVKFVKECENETFTLLSNHATQLRTIAIHLRRRGKLSRTELFDVINKQDPLNPFAQFKDPEKLQNLLAKISATTAPKTDRLEATHIIPPPSSSNPVSAPARI